MRAMMKLMIVPLSLVLIGCGGGGSTKTGGTPSKAGGTPSAAAKLSPEEANMKATADIMVEVAVVLESIKEDKDADDALAKLGKLKTKTDELTAKGKDLKPSPELMEKYMKDMIANGERIGKAMEQATKNAPGKAKDIAAMMEKK